MSELDEILARIEGMDETQLAAAQAIAIKARGGRVWTPSPGPQTDAYFCKADILLYGGAGGSGKALAIDTPIATPAGWSTIGALTVGDQVYDETGAICSVVGATPVMIGRPCFRLRFSDGAEIVADADHGWLTMTGDERGQSLKADPGWRARRRAGRASRAKANSQKPWVSASISRINRERVHIYKPAPAGKVRTTVEIAETIAYGRGLNHSVAVAGALACPAAALPMAPYLLGAWLGDGTTKNSRITMAEPEMVLAVEGAAALNGWIVTKGATKYDYGIVGGMKVALRALGVLGQKRIPPAYLRASIEQRIALLQGLMDTDGYCGVSGSIELSLMNYDLSCDALALMRSLGCKATMTVGTATIDGRVIGPKYRTKLVASFPVFRLPRKLARQKLTGHRGTVRRRYIEAVEPVDSVPVRCIEVDSPSHQYLCGLELIPTHNSDLGLGLAFTAHKRSLILRRKYANLSGLTERAVEIHKTRDGYNGSPPPLLRTGDGRYIQFAGNQHLGDEQDWQGIPFDLKVFDEATQFLEFQLRFHLGWIRSTDPTQRVRAVLATNPPLDADGEYIIGMFRPWLDLTHPKPAGHGELRWYVTDPDGKDMEVDGPTPMEIDAKTLIPKSRTFIPARLSDNPFLVNTGYQKELDALPEPIRSAVRDGNFMATRKDADFQVIPTAWIIDAQSRWTPEGFRQASMTAMALDPAGGGRDSAELMWRHGGWYASPVSATGEETADGSASAGTVVKHRRDGAPIVVDVGGGYGGAVTMRLKDNRIDNVAFNGANKTSAKTKDGKLSFVNKRAEAWWRFREALDPDQQGGGQLTLPPDPELRADLAAPTWTLKASGIQIESKDEIRKRLGRSPGKGDAAVMCWSTGNAAHYRAYGGNAQGARPPGSRLTVIQSHQAARSTLRR